VSKRKLVVGSFAARRPALLQRLLLRLFKAGKNNSPRISLFNARALSVRRGKGLRDRRLWKA
jgi:hypothetical protein